MGNPEETSFEDRGEDEMLPERGDPFTERDRDEDVSSEDSFTDITPRGLERNEALQEEFPDDVPLDDAFRPNGVDGPLEDRGMYAVGQPLEEDLNSEGLPPPVEQLEIPPPPEEYREPRFSTLDMTEDNKEELKPPTSAIQSTSSEDKEGLLVSDLRLQRLYEKADHLQYRVGNEIENVHLRALLTEQIDIVRGQSLKSRELFEEAERRLNEIEDRINLAAQMRRWSRSMTTRLLIYELIVGFLLAIGTLLLAYLPTTMVESLFPDQSPGTIENIRLLLSAILWGGLGGVANALIGILTHRSLERDVDRQWASWYLASPFMGMILGTLLFLILRALLLLLFPSSGGKISATWILYGLAWLAGFQQNIVYDGIERLVRRIETRR